MTFIAAPLSLQGGFAEMVPLAIEEGAVVDGAVLAKASGYVSLLRQRREMDYPVPADVFASAVLYEAQVRAKVDGSVTYLTPFTTKLTELTTTVTEFKSELTATVMDLKTTVTELAATVMDLKTTVTELAATVMDLKTIVTELAAKVNMIVPALSTVRQAVEGFPKVVRAEGYNTQQRMLNRAAVHEDQMIFQLQVTGDAAPNNSVGEVPEVPQFPKKRRFVDELTVGDVKAIGTAYGESFQDGAGGRGVQERTLKNFKTWLGVI
eukprot:TRINITY_DN1132_c0_g1_i2.p1 TRINITY_DN1132_c0_g1~~TRINITY_DN1132_c0_g1_i2.p1  ORF type:complete len:265 (-),score=54.63 TRINITY_DN1132_c0_g1_i2:125-919(-)